MLPLNHRASFSLTESSHSEQSRPKRRLSLGDINILNIANTQASVSYVELNYEPLPPSKDPAFGIGQIGAVRESDFCSSSLIKKTEGLSERNQPLVEAGYFNKIYGSNAASVYKVKGSNKYFIDMKKINGVTLSTLLQSENLDLLSSVDALECMVNELVDMLKEHGIFHSDLHTENVIFDPVKNKLLPIDISNKKDFEIVTDADFEQQKKNLFKDALLQLNKRHTHCLFVNEPHCVNYYGIEDPKNTDFAQKHLEAHIASSDGINYISAIGNQEQTSDSKDLHNKPLVSFLFDPSFQVLLIDLKSISNDFKSIFSYTDAFEVAHAQGVAQGVVKDANDIYVTLPDLNQELIKQAELVRSNKNYSYIDKKIKIEEILFSSTEAGKLLLASMNRAGYYPVRGGSTINIYMPITEDTLKEVGFVVTRTAPSKEIDPNEGYTML